MSFSMIIDPKPTKSYALTRKMSRTTNMKSIMLVKFNLIRNHDWSLEGVIKQYILGIRSSPYVFYKCPFPFMVLRRNLTSPFTSFLKMCPEEAETNSNPWLEIQKVHKISLHRNRDDPLKNTSNQVTNLFFL